MPFSVLLPWLQSTVKERLRIETASVRSRRCFLERWPSAGVDWLPENCYIKI